MPNPLISNVCKKMLKNTIAINKISYLAFERKSVKITLIRVG